MFVIVMQDYIKFMLIDNILEFELKSCSNMSIPVLFVFIWCIFFPNSVVNYIMFCNQTEKGNLVSCTYSFVKSFIMSCMNMFCK